MTDSTSVEDHSETAQRIKMLLRLNGVTKDTVKDAYLSGGQHGKEPTDVTVVQRYQQSTRELTFPFNSEAQASHAMRLLAYGSADMGHDAPEVAKPLPGMQPRTFEIL